jgi:outer membrane protein insertion porin family
MKFARPARLLCKVLGLPLAGLLIGTLSAQQPAPAPKPKTANPFETVPESQEQPPAPAAKPSAPPVNTEPAKPAPGFERPAEAAPEAPAEVSDTIEAIEFRGARRVSQELLRSTIFTRKGDKYDEEALNRDFIALWNSGRFDDIKLEREQGRSGWVIRFQVQERRTIRTIDYKGNKSLSISEILDRFKERRVGLTVESQYDPNRVQRAAVVIKEYLSERGRQFAIVKPEVFQVPPSSLKVVFAIDEGPKVKVGKIDITGNQIFNDRVVKRAMKNSKPIGIPRSILFENIFAKSFDSTKFQEDQERIRNFYQEKGYFKARVIDTDINIRDVEGGRSPFKLFKKGKPGKKADLALEIDEGRKYKLGKINVTGMKLFRAPDAIVSGVFGMREGDTFSIAKLRKGYEEMGKLYGRFGYIDAVTEPYPEDVPNSNIVNLNINVDEGKQFFVRRIDFAGNTTTRDKVIRRELLIDEGDVYNTALWDVSILRLNQLGFFEQLKEKEAADIKRDVRNGTVDITLNVKERGRNTIQLNGGVSGIAGSFVGFACATNNFLGFGETLSLDAQIGDRIRAVTFGFQEPYLLDRPIQAGFTVSTSRFNFDQAREVSLFSGRNLLPLFAGRETLNYVQQGYGFTTYMSTLLRKSFARVGLTYGFNVSNIQDTNSVTRSYLEFLNFRQGIAGPNALQGIRSSTITPTFSYNTVNHPITPTNGKEFFFSFAFTGGPLGGNVNAIQPVFSTRYFRASPFNRKHIIGTRFLAQFLTGYGGQTAPPLQRFWMGGENDVRGFDIWTITPWAFIPREQEISVFNTDGSRRQQRVIDAEGNVSFRDVTVKIPIYTPTPVGGDLQSVWNFEYRVPIAGPVTLAAFFDAGMNRVLRPNQLTLAPQEVDRLNSVFPQANFDRQAINITQFGQVRTSTGLEVQILMPVVNAPFRLYWAYNPTRLESQFPPPVVLDRSFFPNQQTFEAARLIFGQPQPWFERRTLFRFTISRTF